MFNFKFAINKAIIKSVKTNCTLRKHKKKNWKQNAQSVKSIASAVYWGVHIKTPKGTNPTVGFCSSL